MQAESEWEEDEAPTSEIIDLVDQYHRLTTQARANEATITTLKERIVAEFPEEPGEWTRTFGDLILTLGVAESWSWDEAALAVMHGAGDEVPAFLHATSTTIGQPRPISSRLAPVMFATA